MRRKVHKEGRDQAGDWFILCRRESLPIAVAGWARSTHWKEVTCQWCRAATVVPRRQTGRKMKSLGPIYNRSVREDMKALGIK